MRRRKFLQGIVASAGAATLPLPVIAKAAAQTTAKIIPFHYGWACVYAQMNNGVSAGDIERVFRISPHDASSLMDRMLTRGVIGPTGIDGFSRPIRKWEPWDRRHPFEDGPKVVGRRARAKFRVMISKLKAEPNFVQA